MAHLITIQPKDIRPSQDFLKIPTVRFILECYSKHDMNSLPPAPIVRHDPDVNGHYIAIDGHNLLAVKDYFNQDCEVFVAESANDFLTEKECPHSIPEALAQRNKDLREKFDSVVEDCKKVSKTGIKSFRNLGTKYPDLFGTP